MDIAARVISLATIAVYIAREREEESPYQEPDILEAKPGDVNEVIDWSWVKENSRSSVSKN